MWNLKKNVYNKTNRLTDIENKLLDTNEERGVGRVKMEYGIEIQTIMHKIK